MSHVSCSFVCFVFFFNDTATTEIYTLSLHDALPIAEDGIRDESVTGVQTCALPIDRKSTRPNSSHTLISYAVFWCSDVCSSDQIGRAHVCTPVTLSSRMPSSSS